MVWKNTSKCTVTAVSRTILMTLLRTFWGTAKLEKSSTWNNPKSRGSVEFLLLRATVDQENLPRAVL